MNCNANFSHEFSEIFSFKNIEDREYKNNLLLNEIQIPTEIVKSILLNYLPAHDSARMMELSVSWLNLIVTDKTIYKNFIFFESCLASAKLSVKQIKDQIEQVKIYCEIAKIDPHHNFNCAKEVVINIKNLPWYQISNGIDPLPLNKSSEEAYNEIVKVEAVYDLLNAEKTAGKITDLEIRLDALIEVVKAGAHHNLSEAKNIAYSLYNLNPNKGFQAFYEIVKVVAIYDLSGASQIAKLLEGLYQIQAYLEIVKADPAHDSEEIENIVHGSGNDDYRFLFVLYVAQYNLIQAKKMANEIQCPLNQVRAFKVIVDVESKHDLSQAVVTAEKLQDPYCQFMAFIEIAKVDPSFLVHAKQLVQKLRNPCEGYYKIVCVERLYNLAAAKLTAGLINYIGYQAKAYLKIVEVEIYQNISEAKVTANNIKVDNILWESLAEIARVEAQQENNKYIETLLCIYDQRIKEKAIEIICNDRNQRGLSLIRSNAKKNLFLTKKSLNGIKNPALQALAFLEVAKVAIEK